MVSLSFLSGKIRKEVVVNHKFVRPIPVVVVKYVTSVMKLIPTDKDGLSLVQRDGLVVLFLKEYIPAIEEGCFGADEERRKLLVILCWVSRCACFELGSFPCVGLYMKWPLKLQLLRG